MQTEKDTGLVTNFFSRVTEQTQQKKKGRTVTNPKPCDCGEKNASGPMPILPPHSGLSEKVATLIWEHQSGGLLSLNGLKEELKRLGITDLKGVLKQYQSGWRKK